mgnify:FL=1
MQILNANDVAAALPYDRLIGALDAAFASDVTVPQRVHLDVPVPGGNAGTLLLMPAWAAGRSVGVKVATVFPDNATRSLPAVFASYFLMNGETGEPLAVLDGTELTVRRTAAASALASRYLSRRDATTLLMVGTGNLAPHLVRAHAATRPIDRVIVWGRRAEAAHALVEELMQENVTAEVATDLDTAIPDADIISCATLSSDPLVRGALLRDGQHLDLVGAFKPDMRESDSDAVRRAAVYVDTRGGALAEAGDILQAIDDGAITADDIRGDLAELATGKAERRANDAAVTLFKSVGTALEDLAAAELAVRNAAR